MPMKRQPISVPRLWSNQMLDEVSFANVLRIERKRIERSGQHLILMLVDFGNLLMKAGGKPACERFWDALLQTIREADRCGWYGQDGLAAIIFVDLQDADNGKVQHALRQRVQRAICDTLPADLASDIKISLHEFPEPTCGKGPSEPSKTLTESRGGIDAGERHYELLKRVLDISVGGVALILLSPLFAVIAAAIKLTSQGPVLFRQQRIGQHFKRFTFYKFRSMYVGSNDSIHKEYVTQFISGKADRQPSEVGPVFKFTADPRVTTIGRFLRRTSLDELPQLINVLQGDMTLVGPRPCTAYEFECYKLWHRRRLLMVKPGITGLWQVTGRSSVEFDEMVRLDLAYVKARSLWLDLKILLKTPLVVIGGHGAH